MRKPYIFLAALFMGCAGGPFGQPASAQTCYGPGDNANLDPSDPQVVRGESVFQRGNEKYPFSTFSIAKRDPGDPNRICIKYEIENDTSPYENNASRGKQLIKGFRWKAIGLGFTDVDVLHRFKWLKPDFTNIDVLQVSASDVGAFENSSATTTAVFTTEESLPAKSNARPIRSYKIADRFPSTISNLAEAHLPLTPVIPIPNESATKIEPLVTKIDTGELKMDISSSAVYKGGTNYSLRTSINFDGLSSNKVDLYAPTLQPYQELNTIGPEDILKFVNAIQKDGEKKSFAKDGFFSDTIVSGPQSPSEPAFFVVDYPITVRTKTGATCTVVSGFGAYPIKRLIPLTQGDL
jgi:hypothetical protein